MITHGYVSSLNPDLSIYGFMVDSKSVYNKLAWVPESSRLLMLDWTFTECVCVLFNCISCFCLQFDGTWTMNKSIGGWTLWKTWSQDSFYHSGSQRLHHSLWSSQAEPQRLTKNTHIGILCFCCSLYSLCSPSFSAPLSLYKQVFSLLPYCAVVSYRRPCSQHVFGPLLPWLYFTIPYLTYKQTHWPLQALREISNGKQLTKSNYCSFTRKLLSCMKTKQQTTEKRQ